MWFEKLFPSQFLITFGFNPLFLHLEEKKIADGGRLNYIYTGSAQKEEFCSLFIAIVT